MPSLRPHLEHYNNAKSIASKSILLGQESNRSPPNKQGYQYIPGRDKIKVVTSKVANQEKQFETAYASMLPNINTDKNIYVAKEMH